MKKFRPKAVQKFSRGARLFCFSRKLTAEAYKQKAERQTVALSQTDFHTLRLLPDHRKSVFNCLKGENDPSSSCGEQILF